MIWKRFFASSLFFCQLKFYSKVAHIELFSLFCKQCLSDQERLKTKNAAQRRIFCFCLLGEISPNPIDRRFHLRRRACRRLFFFLLALLLRLGFCIFNAEQTGQICLIGQKLAVLIFDFIVFRVCHLFLRKQFCVFCTQLL